MVYVLAWSDFVFQDLDKVKGYKEFRDFKDALNRIISTVMERIDIKELYNDSSRFGFRFDISYYDDSKTPIVYVASVRDLDRSKSIAFYFTADGYLLDEITIYDEKKGL
ncbi:MAG: hypothetical protein C0173_10100 [Desulfurella sp.]|uniref:hypothetical protein n=1 Tax=Desulfurella sp. TaxID=1962857 RepID=UPI000CC343D1|nr:hypothetical protein [Desulfurella sp.]PMP87090.1 MAG: hypothetical protein C0173_10100 [Desulfurella sp.]